MAEPDPLPRPEQIEAANRELVELVRGQLPLRYYDGEKWWTVYTAASLIRMADSVESIMALLPQRRDADAATLLRSLYEQMVTLAWVTIDPLPNFCRWEGHAKRETLKAHNDLARFGESLLSPAEVAAAKAAPDMPDLASRAQMADEHWASRIAGLHAAGHLLGFRGLYIAIYRTASQPAHGSLTAVAPYVREGKRRYVVDRAPADPTVLTYALVAPNLRDGAHRRSAAVQVARGPRAGDSRAHRPRYSRAVGRGDFVSLGH